MEFSSKYPLLIWVDNSFNFTSWPIENKISQTCGYFIRDLIIPQDLERFLSKYLCNSMLWIWTSSKFYHIPFWHLTIYIIFIYLFIYLTFFLSIYLSMLPRSICSWKTACTISIYIYLSIILYIYINIYIFLSIYVTQKYL